MTLLNLPQNSISMVHYTNLDGPAEFFQDKPELNYTRGAQSYKIKRRDYMRKVVNTTYTSVKRSGREGTVMRAIPESNYVHPDTYKEYIRVAAYRSTGRKFSYHLQGRVNMITNATDTSVLLMRLGSKVRNLPTKDLPKGLMKLYEDIVISLLSEPTFVAVSWASNGEPSGPGEGDASTNYPCRRSRQTTIFSYNKVQLLTVYAISVFLAVTGVLLGIQAYLEDGTMRDMKPSSIIEASRASNLDRLDLQEEKLWSDMALFKTKLAEVFEGLGHRNSRGYPLWVYIAPWYLQRNDE
ncbi:hypothetical protein FGRMN_10903 [Fusarium graminum]|nr:hypothetical protein FGRMN_10903 [Fusarium graminum]